MKSPILFLPAVGIVLAGRATAQNPPAPDPAKQAVAQTKQDTQAKHFFNLDLPVPVSPAFTVLGLSPTSPRPKTPLDIATSLLQGVDEAGNVQSGVALDLVPYKLWNKGFHLEDYQNNYLTRFLANAQTSFGTTKGLTDADKSMRLAFGLNLSLYDNGDPRMFGLGSKKNVNQLSDIEQCYYDLWVRYKKAAAAVTEMHVDPLALSPTQETSVAAEPNSTSQQTSRDHFRKVNAFSSIAPAYLSVPANGDYTAFSSSDWVRLVKSQLETMPEADRAAFLTRVNADAVKLAGELNVWKQLAVVDQEQKVDAAKPLLPPETLKNMTDKQKFERLEEFINADKIATPIAEKTAQLITDSAARQDAIDKARAKLEADWKKDAADCLAQVKKKTWNSSAASFAVAPTWITPNAKVDKIQWNGLGLWASNSWQIRSTSQLILHARYRSKEQVADPSMKNTFFRQDSVLAGVRFITGTPNLYYYLDSAFIHQKPAGKSSDDFVRTGVGVEWRIADKQYLQFSMGGESGGRGRNNSLLILTSFKWNFSQSPELLPPPTP